MIKFQNACICVISSDSVCLMSVCVSGNIFPAVTRVRVCAHVFGTNIAASSLQCVSAISVLTLTPTHSIFSSSHSGLCYSLSSCPLCSLSLSLSSHHLFAMVCVLMCFIPQKGHAVRIKVRDKITDCWNEALLPFHYYTQEQDVNTEAFQTHWLVLQR